MVQPLVRIYSWRIQPPAYVHRRSFHAQRTKRSRAAITCRQHLPTPTAPPSPFGTRSSRPFLVSVQRVQTSWPRKLKPTRPGFQQRSADPGFFARVTSFYFHSLPSVHSGTSSSRPHATLFLFPFPPRPCAHETLSFLHSFFPLFLVSHATLRDVVDGFALFEAERLVSLFFSGEGKDWLWLCTTVCEYSGIGTPFLCTTHQRLTRGGGV